jgi:serine/threonine-protein kinase
MGEVYRARDTKLQRDVALKVLPQLFAVDADRLARFEREAQVLASLNHPHIAAIYGLEQSGGAQMLVLELVEGGTLADRLEHARPQADGGSHGLPIPEALSVARQIADGLQAAHERGIVHRDLKPSNVAITHDGQVKVLDFGLAKLDIEAPAEAPASDPNAATMPPLAGASKSAMTSPAAMTAAGIILGTAPYMSPEQAKGRPADKRSDVWAFGCVLYEMLTGRPAFSGEDLSDTLANVLKSEPDWAALPSNVPPAIRTLVQKCLEKDRRKRIADISVAAFILDDPNLLAAPVAAGHVSPVSPRRWQSAALALAALILGSAITIPSVRYAMRGEAAGPLSRLAITASGPTAFLSANNDREIAISPDGSRIAYVGGNGTIFVRSLDQLEPVALTGLGLPRGLFFSPDGQWIGFFDAAIALRKVPVTPGPVITLCKISGPPRGAAWGTDSTIVFATNDPATGLLRVPEGGGDPVVLTKPNTQNDEQDHWWPAVLPDGKGLLFTIVPATGSVDNARVAVVDPQGGAQKLLIDRGSDAHYVSSGHLLYAQTGTVRGVGFDLGRLEVKTTAITVLPQVTTTRFGAGEFDVAGNGTLVYRPLGQQTAARTLVWVDRQGHEEAVPLPPRAFQSPRVAPDGKRVALEIQGDIWIWTIGRDTIARLTFDPALDQFPVWTPDGRRIVFGSDRTSNGQANLYVQNADGSGSNERLTESPNQQFPMSVAPDGKQLVYRESAPSLDLMLLPFDQPKQGRALVNTSFAEQNGEVSPDGRWLAYQSNESGRFEIYVRPFPNVEAGRWQISTSGGIQPLWSKNGQELFYVATTGLGANGAMMAVRVEGNRWDAVAAAKLFDDSYYHGAAAGSGHSYDVALDGKRFLMIKSGGGSESPDSSALIVVQNWFGELTKLVPRK